MEYIIVNESKIKIILNKRDMSEYSLNGVGNDYDTPKVRRAFKKILERVTNECGFDFSGSKTLIQFYESKNGAELFITKLGALPKETENTLKKSGRVSVLEPCSVIYKLDDGEELKSAVKILKSGYDIYSLEGEYYLIFDEAESYESNMAICEFADEISSVAYTYITEHGTKLKGEDL